MPGEKDRDANPDDVNGTDIIPPIWEDWVINTDRSGPETWSFAPALYIDNRIVGIVEGVEIIAKAKYRPPYTKVTNVKGIWHPHGSMEAKKWQEKNWPEELWDGIDKK